MHSNDNICIFIAGSYVSVTCLEGSKILMIMVDLIGERETDVTRLMTQPLFDDNSEYPFDVQIRLKVYTTDQIIFLNNLTKHSLEISNYSH